jgi:arginine deiminase
MTPFSPVQAAEWHPARVVLLCEPNIETLFALLAPGASNFLRPFGLAAAREEHRQFRQALEARGVRVIDLRAALTHGCEGTSAAQERLRAWAASAVTIRFDPTLSPTEQAQGQAALEAALQTLDLSALADLLLLRPTVHLLPNPNALDPTSRFQARYEVAPTTNAYYLRDPLLTTAAGCVIGRLKLAIRQPENDLAEYALTQLGVTPLYRVQPPGHLEGGDFLPCGAFALQGQGLLSDAEGIGQCLERRVYGYVEVAVVEDPRAAMDEMHLDTYFAVLDRDLCALCEDRRGAEEPIVTVYEPDGAPDAFRYTKRRTLGFRTYLEEKGFQMVTFTKAEQEAFAPNGLLLGPRRFLGVRGCGETFARKLEAAGVAVRWLDFAALTGGYGGPHCSSQVLLRG